MAKINAYGFHQVGPTYFTEREAALTDWDTEILTEAWRIRSDRTLQTRIVSVTDVASGKVRKHSSSFRNLGTLKEIDDLDQAALLKRFIERRVENGFFTKIAKVRP